MCVCIGIAVAVGVAIAIDIATRREQLGLSNQVKYKDCVHQSGKQSYSYAIAMVIENKICQLSEYNRAFKAKTFVCASSIYDSNVDYRLQRREAEHFHQTDAFTWDVIDGETDSDEGCGKRRLPLCLLHRYKHRKFNKAYRVAHRSDPLPHTRETESGRERRATVATSHQSDCDKTQQASRDRAVQTPDWADVKLQAPIHADGTRNEQPSSKEAGLYSQRVFGLVIDLLQSSHL